MLTYLTVGSTKHYADITCRAWVVLNLPSLSAMSTARVFEVMASQVALVTPIMDGPENYSMFKSGTHLVHYTTDPVPSVKTLLSNENLRECIARRGYEEVIAKHRLEFRLQQMLDSI